MALGLRGDGLLGSGVGVLLGGGGVFNSSARVLRGGSVPDSSGVL